MILKIALFDFLQKQHNVFYVRLVVTEKDNSLLEMRNKFSRNRQILSSNWQQAEDEVGLVDIERFRITIQQWGSYQMDVFPYQCDEHLQTFTFTYMYNVHI